MVSSSLPLESNPIILRISKELRKLKAWEESSTSVSETLTIGLCGIADLYKCISEILSQQAISFHQNGKCVSELLEVSIKLLEICNATKGMTLEIKEASRYLRAALGGTDNHESSISSYISSRKKIMKNTTQTLLVLKRIGGESVGSFGFSGDEGVSCVIQALSCINIISISIHETLLLFLGLKPKFGRKMLFFDKMIRKSKQTCEAEQTSRNELENVDVAIRGLFVQSDVNIIRLICKKLELFEGGIEGIESGLDSVFRELSQTRGLLLKTFSS